MYIKLHTAFRTNISGLIIFYVGEIITYVGLNKS